MDAALAGIANVDVPGRVERVERGQDFLAVVDYAHKPAALEAVIATLRGQTKGGSPSSSVPAVTAVTAASGP